MSDSDKPFVVKDRRHFTTDGQPREEETPGEPVEPPPAVAPETVRPKGPLPPQKADFASFVISLATQVTYLLDGRGLPEGTSREDGLAGAQSIISILEMLQDKTEGRRTPQESELLSNLLYELRMAYVAQARVSGA